MSSHYTSKEDIYKNMPVGVVVLKNGKHVKVTTEIYDKLSQGKSLRMKDGTVFSKADQESFIAIDDYKENGSK
jgi:hypothetical protein